jgi:hypothetical protein
VLSQSINVRALRWAYEREELGVTAKAVLVTFAIHANERGYTWPGVERIASTWGMDRETVRRQIDALLVRRMIYSTKKRYGATGQVKAYRLPKITYESGGKSHPFENDGSGGKGRDKRGIRGGKSAPNIGIGNKQKPDDTRAHAHTREAAPPESSSSISVLNSQDAQKHPLWKNFSAFCKSRDGSPTLKGFTTWLRKQPAPSAKPSPQKKKTRFIAYEAALVASMERADREHGILQHGGFHFNRKGLTNDRPNAAA